MALQSKTGSLLLSCPHDLPALLWFVCCQICHVHPSHAVLFGYGCTQWCTWCTRCPSLVCCCPTPPIPSLCSYSVGEQLVGMMASYTMTTSVLSEIAWHFPALFACSYAYLRSTMYSGIPSSWKWYFSMPWCRRKISNA